VYSDVTNEGYEVVLRSDYQKKAGACLVVDTTGELRDWTAHADLVIVGKSIIGKGGQNPTEAMAVSVPVLSGPYMRNFEPLVTQVKEAGGIAIFEDQLEMLEKTRSLLQDDELRSRQAKAALSVLETHQGATNKSVKLLAGISL